MTHAATSKVANSAQGLSCKLKFVHGFSVCPLIRVTVHAGYEALMAVDKKYIADLQITQNIINQ
jgi:hypothetical protein